MNTVRSGCFRRRWPLRSAGKLQTRLATYSRRDLRRMVRKFGSRGGEGATSDGFQVPSSTAPVAALHSQHTLGVAFVTHALESLWVREAALTSSCSVATRSADFEPFLGCSLSFHFASGSQIWAERSGTGWSTLCSWIGRG
jgi:hypothetical protein